MELFIPFKMEGRDLCLISKAAEKELETWFQKFQLCCGILNKWFNFYVKRG